MFRAKEIDATQAYHRDPLGGAPRRLVIFTILRQKIVIFAPFRSHFAHFLPY